MGLVMVAIAGLAPVMLAPGPAPSTPAPHRCATVAFIGDSVSYYMEHNLHDRSQPDGLIASAFARHGWSGDRFWLSVGRGRTVDDRGTMHFIRVNPAGPAPAGRREAGSVDLESGLQAVERISKSTRNGIGCWVIALGTNDAARTIQRDDNNLSGAMSRYRTKHFEFTIDRLMKRLGDRLAIWVDTSVSATVTTPPYLPEGAAEWNAALNTVAKRYPNMVIVRWTELIALHPDWYDPSGYHYTTFGNLRRAEFVAATVDSIGRPSRPGILGSLHRLLGPKPVRW